MFHRISHIALRVADVRLAEDYYRELFGLELGFRDTVVGGEQVSLRPGTTWQDAAEAGAPPGLSALYRDGLFLGLEHAADPGAGQVDHIGFDVDESDIPEVRSRLDALECEVVAERLDLLVFNDRFGLRWELTTSSYPSVLEQSTGARLGKWFPAD